MLADRRYCYPLTVTTSPAAICCGATRSSQKESLAFTVFERVFKELGLPRAIRSDKGVPFAIPHALFGLIEAVGVVVAAGIQIERIRSVIRSRTAGMNGCI